MKSVYFTRSKVHRPSLTSDTPSDVEPDDVAPETAISGPVRLPVTAAEELESLPQELAVPPSAPATAEGEDGGSGSENSLLAGVPLSAPGGQTDPQKGQMCFTPVSEFVAHQQEANLPLPDSGVPGGPPPDAAAVGERSTSSAARRPSTPRPRPTSPNRTIYPQRLMLETSNFVHGLAM